MKKYAYMHMFTKALTGGKNQELFCYTNNVVVHCSSDILCVTDFYLSAPGDDKRHECVVGESHMCTVVSVSTVVQRLTATHRSLRFFGS